MSCCDRSRSRSDIRLLPRDGRLDSGDSVQILSTDLRRHGSGSGHQSKTPRIARHSTAEPLPRPPQLNEGVSEGATPRLSMQEQTCGPFEKRSVSAILWAKSPRARPPVSPDHRRRSASRYAILISAARRRAGLRARPLARANQISFSFTKLLATRMSVARQPLEGATCRPRVKEDLAKRSRAAILDSAARSRVRQGGGFILPSRPGSLLASAEATCQRRRHRVL
jgi:hypothetical protein